MRQIHQVVIFQCLCFQNKISSLCFLAELQQNKSNLKKEFRTKKAVMLQSTYLNSLIQSDKASYSLWLNYGWYFCPERGLWILSLITLEVLQKESLHSWKEGTITVTKSSLKLDMAHVSIVLYCNYPLTNSSENVKCYFVTTVQC